MFIPNNIKPEQQHSQPFELTEMSLKEITQDIEDCKQLLDTNTSARITALFERVSEQNDRIREEIRVRELALENGVPQIAKEIKAKELQLEQDNAKRTQKLAECDAEIMKLETQKSQLITDFDTRNEINALEMEISALSKKYRDTLDQVAKDSEANLQNERQIKLNCVLEALDLPETGNVKKNWLRLAAFSGFYKWKSDGNPFYEQDLAVQASETLDRFLVSTDEKQWVDH